MKTRTIWLGLILAVIPLKTLFATDYFVSPDGNDGNPGTVSEPWQHIAYATCGGTYGCPVSTVNPHKISAGDTLYLRGGVYNEYLINISNSGTVANALVIKNYTGETPIIDGGLAGPVFDVGTKTPSSYVVLDGLVVQRGDQAGVRLGENWLVDHFTVQNCVISNIQKNDNTAAVFVMGTKNLAVRNCKLSSSSNGVQLFTGGNDTVIENNEMFNQDIGIYYKHGVNNPATGPVIRNNYFHDMIVSGNGWAVGLTTDKALIENNLMVNTNGVGLFFTVSAGCDREGTYYTRVLHNTIINGELLLGGPGECNLTNPACSSGGAYLPGMEGGARYSTVENNLVYRTDSSLVYEIWNYSSADALGGHNTTSDYNLFYSPTSDPFSQYHTGYNWVDFKNATGQDADSVYGAPVFVGGATPTAITDYILKSGPGKQAASDFLADNVTHKDMGADLNYVGPNPALLPSPLPDAPVLQTPVAVSSTQIRLSWTVASGVTDDRLDVSTQSAFNVSWPGWGNRSVGTGTTVSVTGLIPATTYYFRMRAVGSGGATSNDSKVVSAVTLGVGDNGTFNTASQPAGLKEAYVFPNPAAGKDPTIRAVMGVVDRLEITIFNAAGKLVHSESLSAPMPSEATADGLTYDYVWKGQKAPGVYFAVIHGKTVDGKTVKARAKFAVVR